MACKAVHAFFIPHIMKRHLHFQTLISLVIGASLLFLASCTKEKEKEGDKTPKLTEYRYHRITVGNNVPIKGENLDNLSWEPNNYFVADVDAAKKEIIPKHVGYTQIPCPGVGYLSVEVTPKYTDYDLPFICHKAVLSFGDGETIYFDDFLYLGLSINAIKVEEASAKRSLDGRSTSSMLVYKTGNVKSPYVVYSSKNGVLNTCGVLISPSYLSNLANFVSERYSVFSFDLSKYSAYFVHMKGDKEEEKIDYVGGLQYSSQLGGVLLAFMLPDESKAARHESVLDEMAEELSEILTE